MFIESLPVGSGWIVQWGLLCVRHRRQREAKLLPHLQQKAGTWAPRDKRLLRCISPEVLQPDSRAPRSNWDPFRNATKSNPLWLYKHHWPFYIPIFSWSHIGIFPKLQLTCSESFISWFEGMPACRVLRLWHFFFIFNAISIKKYSVQKQKFFRMFSNF